MDTLRMMLLSLMIGATVSTSAVEIIPDTSGSAAVVAGQAQALELLPVEPTLLLTPYEQQSAVQQSALRYVTPAPATASVTIVKPTSAPPRVIDTGTSITRELYQGLTGDDVRMYQKLLRDIGYDVSVDGTYGNQTRSETVRFQQLNGLKADGIAGARTIRKLVSGSVAHGDAAQSRTSLSYGMVGADVMELQYRLRDLGYYFDLCSGKYLTNTRNGVRLFQSANGLWVDGIAGPETLKRIYSAGAVPAGKATPVPTWPPAPLPSPAPTAPAQPSGFTRNLYNGLSGADVTYFQQLLYNLGYLTTKPTGYFGTETQKATKLFQSYNGLYADGVAGNATYAMILSGKAIPYASATKAPPGIPSPKPTQSPQSGTTCSRCGALIEAGKEAAHHELAACNYHTKCEFGDHNGLSSTGCGHRNCMVSVAANHAKLVCGNHYFCGVSSEKVPQHQTQCVFCAQFECSAANQCASNPLGNRLHSFQPGASTPTASPVPPSAP